MRGSRVVGQECSGNCQAGKYFTHSSTVEQNSFNVADFRRTTDCHLYHVEWIKRISFMHASCCQWFKEQFFSNKSNRHSTGESVKQTVLVGLS